MEIAQNIYETVTTNSGKIIVRKNALAIQVNETDADYPTYIEQEFKKEEIIEFLEASLKLLKK